MICDFKTTLKVQSTHAFTWGPWAAYIYLVFTDWHQFFFPGASVINYKNKLTGKVLIKDKCELGSIYG